METGTDQGKQSTCGLQARKCDPQCHPKQARTGHNSGQHHLVCAAQVGHGSDRGERHRQETVARQLREVGRLKTDRLEAYGDYLFGAVDFLEGESVWHCDIKPDNIAVRIRPNRTRELVLIDFSLAGYPARTRSPSPCTRWHPASCPGGATARSCPAAPTFSYGSRKTTANAAKVEMVRLLLRLPNDRGEPPGIDVWPKQKDIADKLGLSAGRIPQMLKEERKRWKKHPAVQALRAEIMGLLADLGWSRRYASCDRWLRRRPGPAHRSRGVRPLQHERRPQPPARDGGRGLWLLVPQGEQTRELKLGQMAVAYQARLGEWIEIPDRPSRHSRALTDNLRERVAWNSHSPPKPAHFAVTAARPGSRRSPARSPTSRRAPAGRTSATRT